VNHQAKKKFGQNFLSDKNLLKKIVSEAKIEDKNVIEVGPGLGALTVFLAQKAKSVIAYEIDLSLKPMLDSIEKEYSHLQIIYKDFMEVQLESGENEYHVVANVPYYITTPILFKILECDNIRSATLMIQKEVIDRLLAKPHTKAYNALSVLIQHQTDAHKVMDVKRHMFSPIPNVDSAVIHMVKKEKTMSYEKEIAFINWVKEAFRQKRKTLTNNLHQAYNIPKTKIEEMLRSLGFREDIRAEAISIPDFIKIFEVFSHD